ncbi:MAG: hypothetical protein ACXVB9_21240 [Bdellovibrionota bacterium]
MTKLLLLGSFLLTPSVFASDVYQSYTCSHVSGAQHVDVLMTFYTDGSMKLAEYNGQRWIYGNRVYRTDAGRNAFELLPFRSGDGCEERYLGNRQYFFSCEDKMWTGVCYFQAPGN